MSTLTAAAFDRRRTVRFHLLLAWAFLLVGLAGFTPSYWSQVAAGTFAGGPVYHLHGLLLSGWLGLYLAQTALVASGRTLRHRSWGMAGIAWFSVMMCSTLLAVVHSLRAADLRGPEAADASVPIALVSLVTITLASALFAAAIASVGRPDAHKRWMVLVMVVLLQAAVARLVVLPLAPPGPPTLRTTIATALVTDLFVVLALLHDWRTRGRPHGVYVWGGLLVLVVQVVVAPWFARSDAAAALVHAVRHALG